MINDLRACWALLIGVGFMMLGNGLQGTLLGVRATMEGFTTLTTGIIMSGYFVGIFIGSIIAPHLVRRVGHIRVFAALASVASITILIHALYVNPVTWTGMRLMTGVSYAGLYVVAESWLNDRASNETRGQILSVYMMMTTLGMGGGQFLLSLFSPQGVELFVLVSIIVSFGLIPILLTARPAPAFETQASMSLKALYKASPLAVISNCLVGMAHGTIFGLGAVFAFNEFQDVGKVSIFMACILFGSFLLQWPAGWLADHINRRFIMAGMCVLAILACVLASSVTTGSFLYFSIIVLLGGAAIPMYSLTVAYANDRLEPDQIVAASGSIVMVGGVGLSTGPIIVAVLMDYWGNHFYFIGIASAFMAILAFVTWRMRMSDAVAPADQSPAIAAGLIGTPVAQYGMVGAEEYVEALIQDELRKLDFDTANESEDEAAGLDVYFKD